MDVRAIRPAYRVCLVRHLVRIKKWQDDACEPHSSSRPFFVLWSVDCRWSCKPRLTTTAKKMPEMMFIMRLTTEFPTHIFSNNYVLFGDGKINSQFPSQPERSWLRVFCRSLSSPEQTDILCADVCVCVSTSPLSVEQPGALPWAFSFASW